MGSGLKMDILKQKVCKKENIYDSVFALILSVSAVCMTRTSFDGNLWNGSIDGTYINKFGISAVILGILLFIIFRIVLHIIDEPIMNFFKNIAPEGQIKQNKKKILYLWFAIIFVAWLPYYLSYYPGGVYADTLRSIEYVQAGILTNRHPFFYTKVIGFFMKAGDVLGKDLNWSLGAFTAIQMLVLELEFIYFISWMLRNKIKDSIRIMFSLFFIFFPLIPLYAVSVWKDTPFCMAVLFWMMFVVSLYLEICDGKYNFKTFAGFLTGAFLTAFTRNNGIYIVAISVFVLILVLYKNDYVCKKIKRKVIYNSIVSVVIIFFIQGIVYDTLGIMQTDGVENFGIPLQQIGAVVEYDGVVTDEQKEFINNFIPYEKVREIYVPTTVDSLKWDVEFNGKYLAEHKFESAKLWLQLLIQNPSIYVQSYMLATLGFWNVDISEGGAYVQNYVWENNLDIVQTDYFQKWFGFSFQHFVNPRRCISCAWFFWIFFFMAWFLMKHYGWRSVFLFIPQLGVWITLMIAVPVAVSLRYIAANMFTLPFIIIVPLLIYRNKNFK